MALSFGLARSRRMVLSALTGSLLRIALAAHQCVFRGWPVQNSGPPIKTHQWPRSSSMVLFSYLARSPLVVLSGIMARSFVLVLSSILALLGWFHDFLDQQLRHFESSP
jgi:hypothetical protein